MKYVKMLGLAAVAAAALTAFAGASGASAHVLCTTTTTPCTARVTSIHAVATGVTKLTTSFKTIECNNSTVSGTVTKDGSTGTSTDPIVGEIEALTFEECNCEVKVLANGTLTGTNIAGTDNGTVKSDSTEVTATCSTIFGNVHCIYATNETHVGVLTGGADAILHAEEANIPRLTTNGLCAEKAKWDSTYTITNHSAVYVEPGA